MVKCRFGAPLRKRLESRKETETRLKLVGYLEVMGDVVPHWRRQRCTLISSQDRYNALHKQSKSQRTVYNFRSLSCAGLKQMGKIHTILSMYEDSVINPTIRIYHNLLSKYAER